MWVSTENLSWKEHYYNYSCLLNLWLLFFNYYHTCSPKTSANVFFMISFSPGVPLAGKAITEYIYL